MPSFRDAMLVYLILVVSLLATVFLINAMRRTANRRMPPHLPSDLREFTRMFCPDQFRSTPGFPSPQVIHNRLKLIRQELRELDDAIVARDIVEVADALTDLQYVIQGAFLAFGIDADACHREVHASNMRKHGPDGTVLRNVDGKVMKPKGWVPPNIDIVLKRQSPLSL